ncbi:GT99 family glycosyltransferase N-terminal domain-containing protein [Pseudomonas sp. DSP3-2-2]|uniref:GT99 family glycosyltransferase N-terminal domain-containing protein n=1 Tax=unclassified Pseudomonas TaxID=196821 RepID=UPI003CF09F25
MIAVFLPPFAFRGVTAPYLWVFYKFLKSSNEKIIFIIGKEYLPESKSVDKSRWEFSESSQQRLGYTVPSTKDVEGHHLHFLSLEIFIDLLSESNWNPSETFKAFLTRPIPNLTLAIEDILAKHGGDVEGVVTWCNCPSLNEAARTRKVPIIHLELGPLRDPFYRPTMYVDFKGVNGNSEAKARYDAIARSYSGKLTTDELLNYFRTEPQTLPTSTNESQRLKTGIVLQVEDDSNLIAFGNNFDNCALLSYAQLKVPAKNILVRGHPGSLFQVKQRELIIDDSENSQDFIQHCEEIITINSSVGFEALLQSKSVQILGDCSYKFITEDCTHTEALKRLNFYLFNYLVPAELGFDLKYLRFRLNTKDEGKISEYHLHSYSSNPEGYISSGSLAKMIENEVSTANTALTANLRASEIEKIMQQIRETTEQLNKTERLLACAQTQTSALLSSTSWRITAPLRVVGNQAFKATQLAKAFCLAKQNFGAPSALLKKAYVIYRRDGVHGVRSRIRYLLENSQRFTTPYLSTGQRPKSSREIKRHTSSVDIVICIHNALADVKNCLDSLYAYTLPPFRVIIVDDGSDDATRNHIERFAQINGCILHRNDIAGGYTKAANCGLKLSEGEHVVLLNSDTIVSPYWLERLLNCAKSDADIGIVGPLSNTASWQSAPQIFDAHGDWAKNPLPDGMTVQEFANEIANESLCIYPRVGFINGFCFLIKRKVISDIGNFDETVFGRGYGEENDFCLRAAKSGWTLAIADDVYVYHAQSKSYSHEKRMELSQAAGVNLAKKHGQALIDQHLHITANHPALEYIRKRVSLIEHKRKVRQLFLPYQGKRVLFLLPAGGACGGGSNIIMLEASRLIALGIDAQIVNLRSHKEVFEAYHPSNSVPMHYIQSPDDLPGIAQHFDAVIATLYLTVEWIQPLIGRCRDKVYAYYIQDFEPDFFAEQSPEYTRALKSYTLIEEVKLITKTRWNRDILKARLGVECSLIGADYDDNSFHPHSTWQPHRNVTHLTAMIRPATPRRAPELTMRILKRLKAEFGSMIAIKTFGTERNSEGYQALASDFEHECVGELQPQQVSELLRATDIFLDYSAFQAMGLTAMEAIACGAITVGPMNGGLPEIIIDNETGILVDTADEDMCFSKTRDLILNKELRNNIRKNSVSITHCYPELAALKLMISLFGNCKADD